MLLAALATLCSGCVVTCVNPPFDLSRAEQNPALIGQWLLPEKEGGGSVEFRRTRDKEFEVYVTQGERRRPIFTGYSGHAGGRHYLWLTLMKKETEEAGAGHILVRYEVRWDELAFWLLDREKVRAAVAEGRLRGRGIGGEGEVQLSGPAEELASAISGEELWKKEEELRRVKVK